MNRSQKIALALIFGIAIAVFSPSLRNGFVWDDHPQIEKNDSIHDISKAGALFKEDLVQSSLNAKSGYYRPLQNLSYAIDYALFGLNPFWYHLHSLILHAIVMLLLFALLVKMGISVEASVAATLLIGLHPFKATAAAFLGSRGNLVTTAFGLVFLHAALASGRGRRWSAWTAAAMLALFLQLMTHEVGAMLPFAAFILFAALYFKDKDGVAFKRRVAAAAIAVVCVMPIYFVIRNAVLGDSLGGRSGGFLALLEGFAKGFPYVVGFYLSKTVWPSGLSLFYANPVGDGLPAASVAGFVAILAVGIWCLARAAKGDLAAAGLLFFFITLLPVSGIIPLQTLVNDRYIYLPHLGLAVGLAALADRIVMPRSTKLRRAGAALAAAVLIVFSVQSYERSKIYADDVTLFSDAWRRDPASPITYVQLSKALNHRAVRKQGEGDVTGARADLEEALAVWPEYPEGLKNLIVLESARGGPRVRSLLERLLAVSPEDAPTAVFAGKVSFRLGEFALARDCFSKAVALGSNDPSASAGLEAALARLAPEGSESVP